MIQNLVELVAELALQVFDIIVAGAEMPELIQFLLKCPQRTEILFARAAGLDISILKEGVNRMCCNFQGGWLVT